MTIGEYRDSAIQAVATGNQDFLFVKVGPQKFDLVAAIKAPSRWTRVQAALVGLPLFGSSERVIAARDRVSLYQPNAEKKQTQMALECLHGFMTELCEVYGPDIAELCTRDCFPADGKRLTARTVSLVCERAEKAGKTANDAFRIQVMDRSSKLSNEDVPFDIDSLFASHTSPEITHGPWRKTLPESAVTFITRYVEEGCHERPEYSSGRLTANQILTFADQAFCLYRDIMAIPDMTTPKRDALLEAVSWKTSVVEMAAEVRDFAVADFVLRKFAEQNPESLCSLFANAGVSESLVDVIAANVTEFLKRHVADAYRGNDSGKELAPLLNETMQSLSKAIETVLSTHRAALAQIAENPLYSKQQQYLQALGSKIWLDQVLLDAFTGMTGNVIGTAVSISESLDAFEFSSAIQSLSDIIVQGEAVLGDVTERERGVFGNPSQGGRDRSRMLLRRSMEVAAGTMSAEKSEAVFNSLTKEAGSQLLQGLLQSRDKERGVDLSSAFLQLVEAFANRDGNPSSSAKDVVDRLKRYSCPSEALPVDLKRAVFSAQGKLDSEARKAFGDVLVRVTTNLNLVRKVLSNGKTMASDFYKDIVRSVRVVMPDGSPMIDLSDWQSLTDESKEKRVAEGYGRLLSLPGVNDDWIFKLSESIGQTIFSSMNALTEVTPDHTPQRLRDGTLVNASGPTGESIQQITITEVTGDLIRIKLKYSAAGLGTAFVPGVGEMLRLDKTTSYINYECSATVDKSGVVRLDGDVDYGLMLEPSRWDRAYDEPSLDWLLNRNCDAYQDLLAFAEKEGKVAPVILLRHLQDLLKSPSLDRAQVLGQQFLAADSPDPVALNLDVVSAFQTEITRNLTLVPDTSREFPGNAAGAAEDQGAQSISVEIIKSLINNVIEIIGADLFPRFIAAHMTLSFGSGQQVLASAES